MMSKKFLLISLVIALMAGVVALYSCKKDDPDKKPDEKEKTAQELGIEAAQELCDCFSNAADYMEEMNCMMGLMGKYEGLFRDSQGQGGDPDFENAFSDEFMQNCSNIPDWFIQMWTGGGEGDEDFAKMGATAAQELCNCFTEAADEAEQQACVSSPGFMQYVQYMSKSEFTTALVTELQSCNSVPDWIWAQFGGGE